MTLQSDNANKRTHRVAARGFSLPELLLVLLILGNIAAFSIPKILHSQEGAQRKAVFRETIAAYNEAFYVGILTNQFQAGNCATCAANEVPLNAYVKTSMNYVKWCDQAFADGCWVNAACLEPTEPAQILASGASTCGIRDKLTTQNNDNFWIDWDGPTRGSNLEGIDQIRVRICIKDGCPNGQRPGTVIPYPSAASTALYEEIFTR